MASSILKLLQRKRYQYEVTFSLYMLTPTEKIIFSNAPLSPLSPFDASDNCDLRNIKTRSCLYSCRCSSWLHRCICRITCIRLRRARGSTMLVTRRYWPSRCLQSLRQGRPDCCNDWWGGATWGGWESAYECKDWVGLIILVFPCIQ